MPGYSPDEIREFVKRFPERPDPIAAAEDAALAVPGFGEEILRVDTEIGWLTQLLAPPPGKREQLDEERRRLVVEALGLSSATPPGAAELEFPARGEQPTSTPRSTRGRREKAVSELEANSAAAIYADDPAKYDACDDGGAYAVHRLYVEDRDGPALLSRPMVAHLLRAIREGWLPWDARKGRLRISDEFRTSRKMFVIPRRKPAS